MSEWIKRKGIMLCYPFEEKRLNKWVGPYLVQPKLDGERMRAVLNSEGKCTLLSSEENEIVSLPHIKEMLEKTGLTNIEFDGEAYTHGMTFEEIHSIVSRKVNMHELYWRINYHIFDLINDEPQLKRSADLSEMFVVNTVPQLCLQLVPTFPVNTLQEIMEQKDFFYGEDYEGIIVRNAHAYYVRKRSVFMMKFKPKKSDYYRIIGFKEELSKDGVPKGRLGAFVCRGDDGTEFSIGTGMTHDDRQKYWDDKEYLYNSYALVEYQHLTPGRGVPRFPVLVKVVDIPF